MKREAIAGIIEDVAGQARLVDNGLREMRRFAHNTPSFDPERRRFLKAAATLAGTLVLDGCAGLETAGFRTQDWRAWLMAGDLIRGPALATELGRARDFEAHRRDPMPYYGVDYDVPEGTPIVPALAGYTGQDMICSVGLHWVWTQTGVCRRNY